MRPSAGQLLHYIYTSTIIHHKSWSRGFTNHISPWNTDKDRTAKSPSSPPIITIPTLFIFSNLGPHEAGSTANRATPRERPKMTESSVG